MAQLTGLWIGLSVLFLALIVGGAVAGGLLALRMFPSDKEGATAASLHDALNFLLGMIGGGIAGLGIALAILALLWSRVFSGSENDSSGGFTR